ncbi:hypothetical protein FPF80_01055 [Salmonella enterica subsp. enterica]|nr:hypothetical protein [Salmonella enterica subsp. enterica serovar Typhimurium]ECH1286362.1 hypothetical protein [Salmonella enterica subsp. enterica serovar Typhimurium]ECK0317847.1 hypothetical protein [Salmonella enterica subsp. enterica serovar Typhimurium]ECR1804287.1 hypothetical protein [Salmonella enterica subsp. enterica serovar Typhimurium]
MKDLIVQRYNIVTVHRNGEMYDELREKPDGKFCYYKEANESHKEVLAEHGEPVNEELLEALQDMLSGWKYIREQHGDLYGVGWDRAQDKAMAAISKALGEE